MLEYFAEVVLTNESLHWSVIRMDTWISNFKVKKLETHHFDIFPQKVAMRWRQWQVRDVDYFKKFNHIPRKMRGTITRCTATSTLTSEQSCTQWLCLCNFVWAKHRGGWDISASDQENKKFPLPRQLVFHFIFTILTNIPFIWRTWRQASQNSYFNFIYIHTHVQQFILSTEDKQTKDLWHNFFGEVFFLFLLFFC